MSDMTPTTVASQRRALSTYGSSSSVNLVRFLNSRSSEDLLLYSLLPPSCTVNSLSFYNAPPFPPDAMPPLYLNAFDASSRTRLADSPSTCGAVITVPTYPRMRFTMMETICIEWWRSNVTGSPPLDVDIPPDQPGLPDPLWKPEGTVGFNERFRRTLGPSQSIDSRWSDMLEDSVNYEQEDTETSVELSGPMIQVQVEESPDGRPNPSNEDMHAVPTIMVSNSTAIVPLSLESSQSLASAPLALRRGKRLPSPITVSPSDELVGPLSPYPDIPSPFLGSPSSSRPSFDNLDSEPRTIPMDLELKCADLYERLPLMPSLPLSAEPVSHWVDVACEQALSLDAEDDWAGPQEFVEQHANQIPQLFETPLTKSLPPVSPESNSWDMSVTLVDTTEERSPVMPTCEPTDVDAKRQRRKTVIIETSPSPTPRRTSSPATETQESEDNQREQDPIPFETPAGNLLSCTACHNSVVVQSRPVSTLSTRPVRGILKGKKSVRFSMVPECVVHEEVVQMDQARPRSGSVPPVSTSRKPQARRSFAPPARASSEGSPSKEKEPTNWPRHPALRAMARHTADLTSPQAPTPAILTDERRSPLQSLNIRQSLPAKRSSTAVHPEQRPRKSIAVGDIGQPRRLMKAASTQVSVRTAAKADVENAVAKGEMIRHKSRMPVPLRGFWGWGKFRA